MNIQLDQINTKNEAFQHGLERPGSVLITVCRSRCGVADSSTAIIKIEYYILNMVIKIHVSSKRKELIQKHWQHFYSKSIGYGRPFPIN